MFNSPADTAGGLHRVALFGLLFAFLLVVPKSAFAQDTPEAEPDSATAEPVIMQPIAVKGTLRNVPTEAVFNTGEGVEVTDRHR